MLWPMGPAPQVFSWARAEDWLLAAWVAFGSPLLVKAEAGSGPFDAGRPIEGTLGLIAVVCALACLVTTSSDRAPGDVPNVLERASVGPLVGGLLLVTFSAFDGIGLTETGSNLVLILAVVLIGIVRLRWPALPTRVRRGLVTPFTLVAGNLFGVVINQVTGGSSLVSSVGSVDVGAFGLFLGFVAAFAAVYYTMLIYAPRQVAESEGTPRSWILRFVLFLAGTAFGLGWLAVLGG